MRIKSVKLNIILSVILQLVTITCGFILPRLIISNYGSNVKGLLNSITNFLAYITLLESGFGSVVKSLLYKPIANKDKTKIQEILKATENFFKKIAYIFFAYIIILCIIFPHIVSNEFDSMFTVSLVLIIAISKFAEYYFGMTYRLYLQAEQKTYIISIIQIVTLIINTIVTIFLIKVGASIQVVKLFSTMIFIFRPILQNIYVKKKYNINLKYIKYNHKIEQKWDGLAQHIAYVVHSNLDIVLLTFFSNTKEIAVYSVYQLITKSIKNIVRALSTGIESLFGDMKAKGEQDLLDRSFSAYEGIYITISTIFFRCDLISYSTFYNYLYKRH